MKKNIHILTVLLFLAALYFSSCKEVIEKDLKNERISFITPKNGDTLYDPTVSLWWNKIEGATNYRIQIVKNKFTQNPIFVMDSLISKDKFTKSLAGGIFQIRVLAENANSKSIADTVLLVIKDSIELASIHLVSPNDGDVFTNKLVNFSWDKLNIAKDYHVEIIDSAGSAIGHSTINGFPITYTVSVTNATNKEDTAKFEYGKYAWRVNAFKYSPTQGSTHILKWNYFTIFMPAPSSLSTRRDSVVNKDTCKWVRPSMAKLDTIYFFKDAQLKQLQYKKEVKLTPPLYVVDTVVLPRKRDYWWTVRSYIPPAQKSIVPPAKKIYTK